MRSLRNFSRFTQPFCKGALKEITVKIISVIVIHREKEGRTENTICKEKFERKASRVLVHHQIQIGARLF